MILKMMMIAIMPSSKKNLYLHFITFQVLDVDFILLLFLLNKNIESINNNKFFYGRQFLLQIKIEIIIVIFILLRKTINNNNNNNKNQSH